MGEMAPGRVVSFCNDFAAIPQQTVLTDFLVDRIYPVEADGAQVVAKCGNQVLGTLKKLPGRRSALLCRHASARRPVAKPRL